MQHLCSRTLKPSLTESFVDAWTSSLEDFRVSHSVLLESVKLLKTPDISSPTSQTESESANLELFSLKTYKESSPAKQQTESQFSNMSSESWKEWVIEQRQEYSQRKKSAHLIRESESSSWPTATVFDTTGGSYPTEMVDGVYRSKHSQEPNSPWYGAKLKDAVETHEQNWATPNVCGNHNRKGASKTSGDELSTQVKQEKNWQTPTTMDVERTPDGMEKRKAYRESIGRKYVEGCLTEQVKNWATPIVGDAHLASNPEAAQKRLAEGKATLSRQAEAKNWPTMTVKSGGGLPPNSQSKSKSRKQHAGHPLETAVMREPQNWPTATTRDWKDTNATVPPSRANPSKQTLGQRVAHVGLQDQANPNTNGKSQESWPTPRANKVHPEITEENREHLANRKKANLEEDIAGHCGKATGKLNPNWVEHLMGLPAGWTDLGSWETE
jgi:hypothetical protein